MAEITDVKDDCFAYFGDGNTARIVRMKHAKNEQGVHMYRFIFEPSPRIKEYYNLREDDDFDFESGLVIREYQETYVKIVVNNPRFIRVWIYCDFNGEETPLCREDQHYREQIMSLQKSNQSLRIANARTEQELNTIMNSKLKFMRTSVDLVKEARKGGGHIQPDEYVMPGTEQVDQ